MFCHIGCALSSFAQYISFARFLHLALVTFILVNLVNYFGEATLWNTAAHFPRLRNTQLAGFFSSSFLFIGGFFFKPPMKQASSPEIQTKRQCKHTIPQCITKVTSFFLGCLAFHAHLCASGSWFSVTVGRGKLDFPRCRVSWSDTRLCFVFTSLRVYSWASAISWSVSCSVPFLCHQSCVLKLYGRGKDGYGSSFYSFFIFFYLQCF